MTTKHTCGRCKNWDEASQAACDTLLDYYGAQMIEGARRAGFDTGDSANHQWMWDGMLALVRMHDKIIHETPGYVFTENDMVDTLIYTAEQAGVTATRRGALRELRKPNGLIKYMRKSVPAAPSSSVPVAPAAAKPNFMPLYIAACVIGVIVGLFILK